VIAARVTRLALLATCVVVAGLGGGCAPSEGAASSTAEQAPVAPDPVIDGFAIGPERDAFNGSIFHRLEVAARDAWRRDRQGEPVTSFVLHHAGMLADGSTQAGTDEPFTFLMVIGLPGGDRHALVLRCSPLAVLDLGDCG
jgi:hypothetical protein